MWWWANSLMLKISTRKSPVSAHLPRHLLTSDTTRQPISHARPRADFLNGLLSAALISSINSLPLPRPTTKSFSFWAWQGLMGGGNQGENEKPPTLNHFKFHPYKTAIFFKESNKRQQDYDLLPKITIFQWNTIACSKPVWQTPF